MFIDVKFAGRFPKEVLPIVFLCTSKFVCFVLELQCFYLVICLNILLYVSVSLHSNKDFTIVYSFPVWLDDHLCFCILYQRVKQGSRKLSCSVATEDLSKQLEDSKMAVPTEIFLKDYKKPDYYFDSVSLEEDLDCALFTCC